MEHVWIVVQDPEETHPFTTTIHRTAEGAMRAATQWLRDRGGPWPGAGWLQTSNTTWELMVDLGANGWRTQALIDRREILD